MSETFCLASGQILLGSGHLLAVKETAAPMQIFDPPKFSKLLVVSCCGGVMDRWEMIDVIGPRVQLPFFNFFVWKKIPGVTGI